MATILAIRPCLLGTMSIAELVCRHREARQQCDRFERLGDEYDMEFSEADDLSMAISEELRSRLQSFVGNVPIEQVLELL